MPITTADRIASAAHRILAQGGAENVTMRGVASEVGMTPMGLYRHYANRDDLLNAVANAGFTELAGRLDALRLTGSFERQLIRVLDAFLTYAFEKPRLFELMFLAKREGARQYPEDFRARLSPTANVSADVIARAMDTGYFRKDDVWEIVLETDALMQGLIMLFVGGRVAMKEPEFRALCHRSFKRYLNGVRN